MGAARSYALRASGRCERSQTCISMIFFPYLLQRDDASNRREGLCSGRSRWRSSSRSSPSGAPPARPVGDRSPAPHSSAPSPAAACQVQGARRRLHPGADDPQTDDRRGADGVHRVRRSRGRASAGSAAQPTAGGGGGVGAPVARHVRAGGAGCQGDRAAGSPRRGGVARGGGSGAPGAAGWWGGGHGGRRRAIASSARGSSSTCRLFGFRCDRTKKGKLFFGVLCPGEQRGTMTAFVLYLGGEEKQISSSSSTTAPNHRSRLFPTARRWERVPCRGAGSGTQPSPPPR